LGFFKTTQFLEALGVGAFAYPVRSSHKGRSLTANKLLIRSGDFPSSGFAPTPLGYMVIWRDGGQDYSPAQALPESLPPSQRGWGIEGNIKNLNLSAHPTAHAGTMTGAKNRGKKSGCPRFSPQFPGSKPVAVVENAARL